MTDSTNTRNSARRRLLKSVVAGGGVLATGKLLPENWARPVVQSVVLPAHAQTSLVSFDGLFDTGPLISDAGGSQSGSILDMFISPAHAAKFECNTVTRIQINVSGDQARVCLSTVDDAQQSPTSVNLETGELRDIGSVGDSTVGMSDMRVSADASQVTGFLGTCSSFVANRTSGMFSCGPVNRSSSEYLSSPFANKA